MIASIYESTYDNKHPQWVDGPRPLELAIRQMSELVSDELERYERDVVILTGSRTRYFELRGLSGCPVRYRVWVEQHKPTTRVEILPPMRQACRVKRVSE